MQHTTDTEMGPVNVLVVEDEPIIALDLLIALEMHGHRVMTADHPDQLAGLLRHDRPQLALVDITMHGKVEGIAIVERLKTQYDIPAIFVSGQAPLARANRKSALGLIAKPVSSERVAQCVDALGQREAGQPCAIPPELELFS